MRRLLVIVLILGFCTFASATWERLGPYGGYVRSIVISQSDANLIYLTSYTYPGKVVKSTNGGASWNTVGALSGYAYCLALDPTDDNKLYVGSASRIYRSTNGGVDWNNTYMSNSYFNSIVVHPNTPSILYASGMKYESSKWQMVFYKSTDSGVNWTPTIIHGGDYSTSWGLAIDPSDLNTIYVCGYERTSDTTYSLLYKSADGGSSFTDIADDFPTGRYLNSVGVHPTNSNIVYAGATSGIYRSTDAGNSWTLVFSSASYNFCMISLPADPNVVYSGGYYDAYKSTNSGASWSIIDTGLEGKYFRGVAINPSNPSTVYTGSDAGLFRTTNGGSNWVAYNNDLNVGTISSFAKAPSSPATLYTSFAEVGVFKSTNCGSDWTKTPTPVNCGNICEFAIYSNDPNRILGLEGTG